MKDNKTTKIKPWHIVTAILTIVVIIGLIIMQMLGEIDDPSACIPFLNLLA